MSEKLRPLPTWMAKKEDKNATDKETLGGSKKRRRVARTIYCMNEKELVEAAIAYLTPDKCEGADFPTDLQAKDKARKGFGKKPAAKRTVRDSTRSAGRSSEVRKTTYVSETDDTDIAEAETVPYTTSSSPERGWPDGHGISTLRDQIGPVNPGLEADRAEEHIHTSPTVEADDGLQLVREIFFT